MKKIERRIHKWLEKHPKATRFIISSAPPVALVGSGFPILPALAGGYLGSGLGGLSYDIAKQFLQEHKEKKIKKVI